MNNKSFKIVAVALHFLAGISILTIFGLQCSKTLHGVASPSALMFTGHSMTMVAAIATFGFWGGVIEPMSLSPTRLIWYLSLCSSIASLACLMGMLILYMVSPQDEGQTYSFFIGSGLLGIGVGVYVFSSVGYLIVRFLPCDSAKSPTEPIASLDAVPGPLLILREGSNPGEFSDSPGFRDVQLTVIVTLVAL